MPMSHYIACKNYDERIATIHISKVYDDAFGNRRELSQQQVQKNKRIHFMDQFPHQVNFLICRLCYWCASWTDESCEFSGKCPACNSFNRNIESLPVLNIWEIQKYARN